MGNSKSQVNSRQKKKVYLLYFINRTWNRLRIDREQRRSQSDRDTEISSRCSGCKGCDYNQDSLIFDSESEMAPNAEEEMLAVKPWGLQQDKERLRPPTYNAEDYAIALRRWGRRPVTSVQDSHGTLPSTTSSSSGYVSGSGEMTLRQFTSVSELLNKLRADLRLAFPSFVQEFSSSPADGITLLLETLRGVQLVQSTPPSGQTGPRIGTRRAALDELGCVECLAACAERCADAPRLLSQAQPGLLALAVCLTSSLNRSRVLALQLLTKVCQTPGGHLAVSEAVSTLRLRYGEGGRFRFLAGALLAPRAAIALRVAGISFLNAFLKSAPRTQTRLYIQAEACEAGLEPRVLQEWLTESDSRNEDALLDLLKKEVLKWSKNCVDVDLLEKRLARAEETCLLLTNKITVLQNQLDKLKMEKNNDYNYSETNMKLIANDNNNKKNQRLSSNGEDEGISSSERSSTPDDLRQVKPIDNDNDQETTIDDVIEELRIIVKDAEEEDRMEKENSKESRCKTQLKTKKDPKISKTTEKSRTKDPIMNIDAKNISVNYYDDENNFKNTDGHEPSIDTGSLKIVVKGPEIEDAIIPAILYPQPPRRSPPCLSTILAVQDDYLDNPVVYNLQDDDEVEEETLGDGSDSLLSASRLKYNGKEQLADTNKFYLGKNGVESKDSFKAKERSEKKTIRNFVVPLKLGGEEDSNRYHDVYRQFESTAKINGPMERHNSRYRKDPERKKLLRRSVSHDYLNSEQSSPNLQRSGSKIEGKIRKFESLNSFDNSSLINFTRSSNRTSRTRGEQFNGDNSRRIRRSESCHHVSHPLRKSSKSGSDSGLHYITDYDLQPVMTHAKIELELGGQLTKSLDRIDEGLDTMVDIVIGGNDRKWLKNGQIGRGNNLQSSRSCDPGKRQVNSSRNKGSKNDGKGSLKNDELYNGVYSQTTLRNDELYREDRSQWNISGKHGTTTSEKIHNFTDNNLPIISSFYQGKGVNRFSMNESGVFSSTGRPYDAFGLGKNRFNAGKYSGNPTTSDTICVKRNSVASNTVKRGKVTDIISGLY